MIQKSGFKLRERGLVSVIATALVFKKYEGSCDRENSALRLSLHPILQVASV